MLLTLCLGWLLVAGTQAEEACPSEVYCWGTMLHQIQMAGLFADSKQFVDMPTRFPAPTVICFLSVLTKGAGEV